MRFDPQLVKTAIPERRLFLARTSLAVGLLVLVPTVTVAQSAISGVVKDTSGAVLPGVTVEAASPALIEKVRAATTNDEGQYKIVDLRPGIYIVTFTLTGFNTFKRDGMELPSGFTATVNAELTVGALQETVTVTGQASVVDVQNVTRAQVLGKQLLDAIPTARLPQTYTSFIPGVTRSAGADGQGLSNSTQQVQLSIHGSRIGESQISIDGFTTRNLSNAGNIYYYINAGYVQEQVVTSAGGAAEQALAGLVQNAIPKEGGNRFSGQVYAHYTDDRFLGENLTDAVKATGVSANSSQKEWNINPSFGGPLMRDKLWFFGSYLHQGSAVYAGIRYNLTPSAWVYTPDPNRPIATQTNHDASNAVRFTWQATRKNKVSVFFDLQPKTWKNRSISTLVAPEASTWSPYIPLYIAQGSWKAPLSNRLLLEAGAMYQNSDLKYYPTIDPLVVNGPAWRPDLVSALELTTNIRTRANNTLGDIGQDHLRQVRAAASYITGAHAFKAGLNYYAGDRESINKRNGDYLVSLRNGVPSSLTLYTPYLVDNHVTDLGLYVQDQWTLKRVSLNVGVRYDRFIGTIPPQDVPAGRFIGARHYDPISDVPTWNDIVPRMGVAYDLFGNGKTALKASLNKYVNGYGIEITNANNPVNTSVASANRTWIDDGRNGGVSGDFLPQCNFSSPAANGECGVLSNLNFGLNNPGASRYDSDVLNGWNKRDYNWETSLSAQHEFLPGLSLTASYFRRWFGNMTVTQNQLVTPADFNPYCLTEPVDPRLPGGGGNTLCGFYDVSIAKAGQSKNLVTFASNFPGTQTQVFNGVDITLALRFRNGAQVTGGTSTGRTEANACKVIDTPTTTPPASYFSGATQTSISVSSWNAAFCDIKPPFQTQIKFLGVYPLPWWGLQMSGAFQNVAGPEISATTYVATNAEVAPTLGRNLSSGAAGTVTLPLMAPGTLYAARWGKVDLRFSKTLKVRQMRVIGSLDVFNALNSSAAPQINTRYGPSWLQPTAVLGARLFQFSGQIEF